MTINITTADSFAKSWAPDIAASAAGLTIAAHSVLFNGARYDVPAMEIPCVYADDAAYRVALCKGPDGPVIVLIEDDALPPGHEQIIYLARWRFASNTDTCASVAIECPRRVLVPRPPQVGTRDVMGTVSIPVVLDGEPVPDDKGNPVMRDVQRVVRTETFEIPPEPLPEPAIIAVATTPVLPVASAEKTRGRKRAKRIKQLTQQARDMRAAGTTYGAMTAAQRQAIGELVALLADVPMELP